MSSGLADAAVFAFLAVLTVLLAGSLLAVARLPVGPGSTAATDPLDDADPPVTAPLPRRAAGRSGLAPPIGGQHRRGIVRPVVSGGPPWGPAPRPPDVGPWT